MLCITNFLRAFSSEHCINTTQEFTLNINNLSKFKKVVHQDTIYSTRFLVTAFEVKEDNSITVGQRVWPLLFTTTQKPPLVRTCRNNVGPTVVSRLDQCQHADLGVLPNVSFKYCPTLAQQLIAILKLSNVLNDQINAMIEI